MRSRAAYKRLRSCWCLGEVQFLGLELDSAGTDVGGLCVRLSDERRQRCLDKVTEFLRRHRRSKRANRRELAVLAGELMFASNAVPAGRTFLSRLYCCIAERPDEPDEELAEHLESVKGDHNDYDRLVPFTTGCKLDLVWWQRALQ